jgi:hypothetical protein
MDDRHIDVTARPATGTAALPLGTNEWVTEQPPLFPESLRG